MYNSQEIASRIKRASKKREIPLGDLLANCELGKNTVSKIASGTDILTLNFAKIADELDCSVDYLLGRTDNPAAHRQSAHTIFSNNSDVRGGIGNNSRISINGSATDEVPDEQLQELIKLYSGLSTRKKAELLIMVDDFAQGNKNKEG